jgi:signal peptidase I
MLRERISALLRWALRVLWLAGVPALLAALTFRYLIPSAKSGAHGLFDELAQVTARYPAPLAAALFVYYAAVVRYWSPQLPGAAHWLPSRKASPLPAKALVLWCVSLGLAVLGALFLRSQLYEPYRVLSASMLPTLEPSALIIAKPSAYGWRALGAQPQVPRRGDVIVFRTPQAGIAEPLVKRVIGLPGDTISTHIGHPLINGWLVPSCNAGHFVYLSESGVLNGMLEVEFLGDKSYLTVYSAPLRPDLESYTVPPGQVFLFGDNRNNSSDSRAWNDGAGGSLPLSAIMGRVDRLLVGVQRNGDLDLPSLFRPLGAPVAIEGLDSSALRAGIERCKSERPKQTQPPAKGASL